MTAVAASATDLEPLVERVAAATAEQAELADAGALFPVAALAEMRRTRLLGLIVAEEHGGLGRDLSAMLRVTERLAREDMSVAMIFAMHCQQVAAIVRHARDPLRARLLARIGSGELYLASVTTSSGSGADLHSSSSRLSIVDGLLALDRLAPVVTGGRNADGFLVTVRSPDARSDGDVSLVYADRDQLDIEPVGEWQPLGMRATDSGAVRLRGQLPADQVIGEHGRFRDIIATTFGPWAHLGWSAAWLGTASGVLSRVVKALRDPKSRGSADLSSELLLTRLATARHALEAVHALLWHAVDVFQQATDLSQPRVQLLINGLKVTASEQCYAAVDGLVEALGLRHGYLRTSPTRMERALRDLRSASLNYSNDRLRIPSGKLTLVDSEVCLG